MKKALPKMAKKASSAALKTAFTSHLKETEGHVKRLEQVGKSLDISLKGKTCHAMEGLIEEGSELLKEDVDPAILDAAMIGAAQRVEHYEIAGYGTARTFAEMLGHTDAAQLLQHTLDEEKDTDQFLTELAMTSVNVEAQNQSEL